MEMEQEPASIARFILEKVPGLTPYYEHLPEDFMVPSVYFPKPVPLSRGDTLGFYALEYDWMLYFFAHTDEEAQENALAALNALCHHRRLVPLIQKDGEPVPGKGVRLGDPSMRSADNGAYILQIPWVSRKPYIREEGPPVESVNVRSQIKD